MTATTSLYIALLLILAAATLIPTSHAFLPASRPCPIGGNQVVGFGGIHAPGIGFGAAKRVFGFVGRVGHLRTTLSATSSKDRQTDDKEQNWDAALDRLRQYKDRCGDANVPYSFNDGNTPHLGHWVATQRKQASKGTLSQHRTEKLEAIGFIFNGIAIQRWKSAYQRLAKYREEFGNINVRKSYNDGKRPHLGKWLQTQRREYRKGRLAQAKINKLEDQIHFW